MAKLMARSDQNKYFASVFRFVGGFLSSKCFVGFWPVMESCMAWLHAAAGVVVWRRH
jgi:hypothetical protein